MSAKQSDSQSSYARKKEEEQAKKAKDQAERNAALDEFSKYFGNDDEDGEEEDYVVSIGDKRHRAPGAMISSGPGTLEPDPSAMPFSKKPRIWHGNNDDGHSARLASSDIPATSSSVNRSAKQAVAKPTVQLQNLPMRITETKVKSLLPDSLQVLSVRLIPPPPTSEQNPDRRSMSAYATLHQDTVGRDVEDAIRLLDNTYIGFGHYLKISKGLSSTAMESKLRQPASLHSSLTSLPFGARTVPRDPQINTLSRAPPPAELGARIPPPQGYPPSAFDPRSEPSVTQVNPAPPSSLNEVKMIHRTIQQLLQIGPTFEALLMSRPEVQNEEKWAWIWDARSRGGVYYRWRLWQFMTGSGSLKNSDNHDEQLFSSGPKWTHSGKDLPYEFLEDVGDITLHSDYDSEAEDDSEDESFIGNKTFDTAGVSTDKSATDDANICNFLDPMQKAKLMWLLRRLPPSTSKLTRADVAHVMGFAIDHANVGAEEIVNYIVFNVARPFSLQKAAEEDSEQADYDGEKPADQSRATNSSEQSKSDDSSARMVGLYVIHDIMHASMECEVRSAWKYRGYLEKALAAHNTFGRLGRLDRDLKMGRMTAEKWKRSVHNLLRMWKDSSMFDNKAHEDFVYAFDHPQLTDEEKAAERKKLEERKQAERAKSGFKSMSTKSKSMQESGGNDESKLGPWDEANMSNQQSTPNPHQGLPEEALRSNQQTSQLKQDQTNEEAKPTTTQSSSSSIEALRARIAAESAKKTKPEPEPEPKQEPITKPPGGGRARAEDMFADSD